MEKVETYCESQFIVNFCLNVPNDPLDDKQMDWVKIFNIISKKSVLLIDSKQELLDNLSNPYVKHIIKSSNSGGSDIVELSNHFEAISGEPLHILTTNNCSPLYCFTEPIDPPVNCGLFVANESNFYRKFRKITKGINPISVSRDKEENQFNSWSEIFADAPPLNTIIIADNYLLDKTDSYKNNLYAILDALLPSAPLEESIHIAIITNKELVNSQNKLLTIETYLNSKNFEYSLGLYLTPKDKPHDRFIMTNYFYLTSGHTLEIKNNKGNISKDTVLTYIPLCSTESISAYNDELRKLAKYTKNCPVLGDHNNRLLEYYR